MKLIEDFPFDYHIRMRNQDQVDDIIIRADDFASTIINILGGQGVLAPIFDPDLEDGVIASTAVGNIPAGITVGELRGEYLQDIWARALFEAQIGDSAFPIAALEGSGIKLIEVGTTINPILTGQYTQNDGGTILSVSLDKDDVEIATTIEHTDTGLTSATPVIFTYDMVINYSEGPIPLDTQGNPVPEEQIPAGSITTNDVNYEFIYPFFWGLSADGNVDAADIIAGTKVVSKANSLLINFNSTSSDFIWFAVPASYADYESWLVTVLNAGNIGEATDLFNAPSIVAVTTAEWSGINYKLYVSSYSTEVTSNMQIT